MTIKLTQYDIREQFKASEERIHWDPSDELDITYKFDARLSQGWSREIWLREGIYLSHDQHKLSDEWVVSYLAEQCKDIHISFMLAGQQEKVSANRSSRSRFSRKDKQYNLWTNGLSDQEKVIYSDTDQYCLFHVAIQPEILCAFTGTSDGELPESLQHLIKSSDEAAYQRDADIQPLMNTVIQQILQCPYRGMVKRAYLEGKTIELIALVLDHEIAIQQGEVKQEMLKPEQIERIYYARELLLKDLVNPPSLTELAQQVGLSASALGKGFRKVFDTTVFAQLQAHRLAIAKQLLAEKDTSIYEVAYLVGYASINSFSKAFKQTFGVRPKDYQKSCR
ncbi:MAG: AraC family transcriptional regulator [Cyanobacteria bacterium P01_D01_bin.115]